MGQGHCNPLKWVAWKDVAHLVMSIANVSKDTKSQF